MAEAVVRVQKAAGELARQVSALDRDSTAVVERLRRIDPQIAAASKNLDAYHEQIRAGGALSDQERFRMERLQRFVAARSQALTVQTTGRAPTEAEVESARATGRYTEDRLARMRIAGQSRVFPKPVGQIEAGISRAWAKEAAGEAVPEDAAVKETRAKIAALETRARARATAVATEAGVEPGSRTAQEAAGRDAELQSIHAERKSLWRGLYGSAPAPVAPGPAPMAPAPSAPAAPAPPLAPDSGPPSAPAVAPAPPQPAPLAPTPTPPTVAPTKPAPTRIGEPAWDFRRLNGPALKKELEYAESQLDALGKHPAAAVTIQSRISALKEEMLRRESPASGARVVPGRAPEPPAAPGGGDAAVPAPEGATAAPPMRMRDREKALSLLLDTQLIEKWQRQTEALAKQQRGIRDVGAEYDKLTATKKAGGKVDEEALKTSEASLRQLYEERTESLATVQALRNVGAERGLSFPRLPKEATAAGAAAGGGGWRQNAGVFLAGAGIGGGSIGGTLAGAALGALSWPKAMLTVAGMGAGWAWHQGSGYAQSQEQTLQAGMTVGGGYRNLRRAGHRNLEGPLFTPYEETMAATEAWATQTGRRDLGAIPAFARLYGLGTGRTAGQLGGLARYGVLPSDRATTRMVPRRRWVDAVPVRPSNAAPTPKPGAPAPGAATAAEPEGWGSWLWRGTKAAASGAWGLAKDVAKYAVAPDPWSTPLLQMRESLPRDKALAAMAQAGGLGQWRTENVPERTARGGIAGTVAAAYKKSYGLNNRAFMEPYIGQYLQLAGVTARGGAPITPEGFGGLAGVQAAATRIYGRDANPEFGGRLATQAVGAITHPRGEVARGVGIRSLAEMWGGMSEAERAEFKTATEKKFRVKGGLDPSTVPGAVAVMENAFSLGGKMGDRVTRALTGGLSRLSGSGQVAEMFWGAQTGNQMTGIQMARNLDRLRRGEKLAPETEGDLRDQVTKALSDAGDESKARAARGAAELAGLDVGKAPALLGEAIKTSVMNLISTLTETRELWNSSGLPGVGTGAPMSPAPGTR